MDDVTWGDQNEGGKTISLFEIKRSESYLTYTSTIRNDNEYDDYDDEFYKPLLFLFRAMLWFLKYKMFLSDIRNS